MKTYIITCIFAAAVLTLCACKTSPESQANPIFISTQLINVSSPTNGQTVTTNYPDFSWQVSGQRYEVAAVFTKHIQVSGKQIQNTNDCIGMWDTGMTGTDGSVNYSEFREVSGGLITGSQAAPLAGGTYYWAVWAYDSGMVITNSSAEITFKY